MGVHLVPLLVTAGHDVTGMTRTAQKVSQVCAMGATAVVCDVFDQWALTGVVADAAPDVIVHQVTDLPDAHAALAFKIRGLNRARREGTDNLVAAAQAAHVRHFVAQSVAFALPGIAQRAVDHLEQAVLGIGGVVARYGMFYGPGTWYDDAPNGDKVVHIGEAARQTARLLGAPSGTVEILDPA